MGVEGGRGVMGVAGVKNAKGVKGIRGNFWCQGYCQCHGGHRGVAGRRCNWCHGRHGRHGRYKRRWRYGRHRDQEPERYTKRTAVPDGQGIISILKPRVFRWNAPRTLVHVEYNSGMTNGRQEPNLIRQTSVSVAILCLKHLNKRRVRFKHGNQRD